MNGHDVIHNKTVCDGLSSIVTLDPSLILFLSISNNIKYMIIMGRVFYHSET